MNWGFPHDYGKLHMRVVPKRDHHPRMEQPPETSRNHVLVGFLYNLGDVQYYKGKEYFKPPTHCQKLLDFPTVLIVLIRRWLLHSESV